RSPSLRSPSSSVPFLSYPVFAHQDLHSFPTRRSSDLLISEWYEQKSLIITSNLEFSQWNRIFVDGRLTAALVDRLIHHAHVLSFTGESYRLSHALSKSR